MARLLSYTAQVIPLGEMVTWGETRLFAVLAGCGPDGALMHTLGSRMKARFGRSAYYAHAVRLLLTRRWPSFTVEFRRPGAGAWESSEAVAMMASRVPDLGGLFSAMTPQASLVRPHLQVQLVRAPAQLSLPAWMLGGHARLPNPWLDTIDVEELRCTPLDARTVYGQADGEPMGSIPLTMRMIPAALSLMMPLGVG